MAFGEILVVWYGWNKGTCAAVSEVRMRKRTIILTREFMPCGRLWSNLPHGKFL